MAKKFNCPTPVRTVGGAAPACVACEVVEEWCYRLEADAFGVIRHGKRTYDRDENCQETNEKWIGDDGAEIDRCTAAITDLLCGEGGGLPPEPEPPEPITFEGQDCEGQSNPATGLPGEIVQIVQAPGQVITVRVCEDDRDFELSCGEDPVTGHQIQTAYRITAGAFEVIKRWDVVTGFEWTGDPTTLESCGATKLESDSIEMCDSGVEFIRWVVKSDGEPVGKIDTDLSMQPYTVTDESTVTRGKCEAGCPVVTYEGVQNAW